MKNKKRPIAYQCIEDCTLQYHNFRESEVIVIADHCEDHDWLGTDFYDKHPDEFMPLYTQKAVKAAKKEYEASWQF